MEVEELLDRLDGVVKIGDRRWKARCPAHDDRDPSFTMAETIGNDGTRMILMHCFSGCSKGDILQALGISLSDLYPDGAQGHHIRPLYMARQEKKRNDMRRSSLEKERLILEMARADRAKGKKLSPKDIERERLAFQRVRGGR